MALVLNGTSHYLSAPYSAAIAGTTNITLCAWVKPSVATRGKIVGRHNTTNTSNSYYALELSNGQARMGVSYSTWFGMSASMTWAAGGTITAGNWYHLAGTWDGTTISVYVNGVRVDTASQSGSIQTGSSIVTVGAHHNGSSASNYFGGELEDIRQYNRTLSANEIMTMFTVRGRDFILNNLVFQLPLQMGVLSRALTANEAISDMSPSRVPFVNRIAGATSGSFYSSIRN